jgi:hypothetical protein
LRLWGKPFFYLNWIRWHPRLSKTIKPWDQSHKRKKLDFLESENWAGKSPQVSQPPLIIVSKNRFEFITDHLTRINIPLTTSRRQWFVYSIYRYSNAKITYFSNVFPGRVFEFRCLFGRLLFNVIPLKFC